MKNSHIEWTDHTFNPWIGCTKVSPGCAHCYAENATPTRVARKAGRELWGKGQPRQRTSLQYWRQPLRWNAVAQTNIEAHPDYAHIRPRVFCGSLCDILDDEIPIKDFADLLTLIHQCQNLDWQLLTKRPENWLPRVQAACELLACDGSYDLTPQARAYHDLLVPWREGRAPANIWIGTTVENQQYANTRIPKLLAIPAKIRFLSAEPLLGPINLLKAFDSITHTSLPGGIHWVIAGGESGPEASPMHPDWPRALRNQCQTFKIPYFFKQWGQIDSAGNNVGKAAAGRALDGQEWSQFPAA